MSALPLNLDDIRGALRTKALGHSLYLHQELPSTNKEALALAQGGAVHGTVVLAESQSAGRGRLGRIWFSPPGMNLYCSIIVRGIGQRLSLSEWLSWLPLVTALAVRESVFHQTSVRLSLKWPNDLLLREQKIGGILCETASSIDEPVVVIGIGLNVNLPRESFPTELQAIATSLRDTTTQPIDRNTLLAQLLLELEMCLDELHAQGTTRLRTAYIESCATLGQQVRVVGPEQEIIGWAETIAADGALRVRPRPSSSNVRTPPLLDIRAADIIHLR